MKGLAMMIVSTLLAASMLTRAIMNFKRNYLFVGNLETVLSIIWTAAGVCAMWHFITNTIG